MNVITENFAMTLCTTLAKTLESKNLVWIMTKLKTILPFHPFHVQTCYASKVVKRKLAIERPEISE